MYHKNSIAFSVPHNYEHSIQQLPNAPADSWSANSVYRLWGEKVWNCTNVKKGAAEREQEYSAQLLLVNND